MRLERSRIPFRDFLLIRCSIFLKREKDSEAIVAKENMAPFAQIRCFRHGIPCHSMNFADFRRKINEPENYSLLYSLLAGNRLPFPCVSPAKV